MPSPMHAVVLALLGLAGVSKGLPIVNTTASTLSEPINGTETVLPITKISISALPEAINDTSTLSEVINVTDTAFANDTNGLLWLREPPKDLQFHARALEKRSDLPPCDRTLADHMENHGEGLPECYKKCMRSEDGKSQIHMGKDTLGQICGIKWPLFAWWSEHHIYFCVNGKHGCPNKQAHRDAYKWLKSTCGDKPS